MMLINMTTSVVGQYYNQINVSTYKQENTFNYLLDQDDTLVSFSSVNDSNANWNFLTFKKYDENFNIHFNNSFSDSTFLYSNYYGFENLWNNYYSCGTRINYANLDTLEGYVVKLDNSGNIKWLKRYYSDYERSRIVCLTSRDSLVFALSNLYNPSSTGEVKVALTAIDTTGQVVWEKFFTGQNEQSKALKTNTDNGFIISLSSQSTGESHPNIYKLDSLGNIKWMKNFGSTVKSQYLSVTEMPNGNYLAYGSSESPIWDSTYGRPRAWLLELDKNTGNIIKDSAFWLTPYYSGFGIYSNVIFNNNEMIITGVLSDDISNGTYKAFIASISYDFEINWLRKYQERESDQGFYNIFKKDGFYHLQGLVYQDDTNNTNDEWFVVVDSLGCDDQWCTVGINDAIDQYNNESNVTIYPNPSSGNVTFQFEDFEFNREIVITDLLGKEVGRFIVNGLVEEYQFYNVRNGVYLIHIVSNGIILQTQKVVLQQ